MSGNIDRDKNLGQSIKEVSLSELFADNNLVIPEIQREYVWGDKKIGHRVLSSFFSDFLDDVKVFVGTKGGVVTRVGFVYAYIPGFAKEETGQKLAFLIDGQQRITTFFLIWLHLASKAGKIEEFKDAIRYRERDINLAFDFKVRPLTHEFVNELVKKVVKSDTFEFSSIDDTIWFLSDYRHDVSVMSMVNALKVWDKAWKESGLDAGVAYEYLTKHVLFWLFVR